MRNDITDHKVCGFSDNDARNVRMMRYADSMMELELAVSRDELSVIEIATRRGGLRRDLLTIASDYPDHALAHYDS